MTYAADKCNLWRMLPLKETQAASEITYSDVNKLGHAKVA